ncbi:hypothetical protein GWC77_26925 [Paraburkholderia sp. NMBU_R16]|uniref:hypothetical protein n=1 Tax=Paraburkholderia sp. NMBU_R16 TaxID=2698676 RepID=UPI0015658A79|nr:hypothetical protein [Paraburkholderia sp. NMBU_R16]NRO99509.1 hypothetical protein [Paraburkholderia sp. NMBU_R16]
MSRTPEHARLIVGPTAFQPAQTCVFEEIVSPVSDTTLSHAEEVPQATNGTVRRAANALVEFQSRLSLYDAEVTTIAAL